tara:strand:+ start:242 stop:394 length:153 start_codon:yes stop_codon:yes gene_type:complete
MVEWISARRIKNLMNIVNWFLIQTLGKINMGITQVITTNFITMAEKNSFK